MMRFSFLRYFTDSMKKILDQIDSAYERVFASNVKYQFGN